MKNKLKILKNIRPDQKRKEKFRGFLAAQTMRAEPAVKLFSVWNFLKPLPIASLLLAVSLLGGGAVFASQSSLPGDILYPVKLGAEKIRVALTPSPAKKASLHLEFASERLKELNQIIEKDKSVKDEQLNQVFTQYKTELDESEKTLVQTTSQKPEIAAMINKETESDKKAITEMSEKISRKERDGKFSEHLKEAYAHAELKNDAATIAIFSTSGQPTTVTNTIDENDNSADGIATSTENILATSTSALSPQKLIEESHDKMDSSEHINKTARKAKKSTDKSEENNGNRDEKNSGKKDGEDWR